jgi:hypothetical protein
VSTRREHPYDGPADDGFIVNNENPCHELGSAEIVARGLLNVAFSAAVR